MKKIVALAVVLALLALSGLPAPAAGGHPGKGKGPQGPKAFVVSGPITAKAGDEVTGTITVHVVTGNRAVQDDESVAVQITGDTRLVRKEAGQAPGAITFADLPVGGSISAQGSVNGGTLTAKRVTVWVDGKPNL